MTTDTESPFDFPCTFPVKAMGRDEEGFEATVVGIVRRHAPDLGEGAVTTQASRRGRYVSVTVTITATSREQLDAIYNDLTAHHQVLMAL
ncbi:MAG: DUF493 domain-containing protein [Gammaproteobacteria bacterium]|nr:DUF493 domain-containing protein [Gammaproteobacteria bacterium]